MRRQCAGIIWRQPRESRQHRIVWATVIILAEAQSETMRWQSAGIGRQQSRVMRQHKMLWEDAIPAGPV